MKQSLKILAEHLHQLKLRERLLVLVIALLAPLLLVDYFFLSGFNRDIQAYQNSITELDIELQSIDQEMTELEEKSNVDPNKQSKLKIETLTASLETINNKLKEAEINLVKPQEMTQLLQTILTQTNALKLINMENSKPVKIKLLELPKPIENCQDCEVEVIDIPEIFQHKFQLTLQGDYVKTLSFVDALERLPNQLFWDEIYISMKQYPKAMITIILHTLSLNQKWIGV